MSTVFVSYQQRMVSKVDHAKLVAMGTMLATQGHTLHVVLNGDVRNEPSDRKIIFSSLETGWRQAGGAVKFFDSIDKAIKPTKRSKPADFAVTDSAVGIPGLRLDRSDLGQALNRWMLRRA